MTSTKKNKQFPEYKTLRNKVNALVKNSKKKYFQKLIDNGGDTASLWKAMNEITHKTRTRAHESKINFTEDEYNSHFLNISNVALADIQCTNYDYEIPQALEDFVNPKNSSKSFKFPPLAVHEVGKYVMDLPNKRSMGPDDINSSILKVSLPYIVEIITYIFNLSIEKRVFPTALKSGKVIPIPKAKNPSSLNDYRPISLLSVLSKPLEKHMHKHLMQFIEENKLLYNFQSGFRKHHSCHTALTNLCDKWLSAINERKVTGAVFLDLKKAFDLVNHDILLTKLKLYIKNNDTISFLSSYLSDRTQCVHLNGKSSSFKAIKCGVPQGSIMGPLLFCLFINDLPLSLENKSLSCDLFADDNSLHTSDKDIAQVQITLQQGLLDVQNWCNKNKMVLNPAKTKSMVITTRQKHQKRPLVIDLQINATPISQVNEHKVLGVIIDDELSWHCHVKKVTKAVSRNLFLLKQLKQFVGLEARKIFFYAHCLSHFNYASSIWCMASENTLKHLNSLHRRAIKLIHTDPTLSTELKMKSMDILPLDKQFMYNTAVLMFKVHTGLAPGYLNHLLTPASNSRSTRSQHYILPLPRIDKFKSSFSFSGPSIWNLMPQQIHQQTTIGSFKKNLRKHLFNQIK